MAEPDRRRERRLRYLEDELRYCRERAKNYTERAEQLERDRAELRGDKQSRAGEGASGLADLVKNVNPETVKEIVQAMQGIDLQPLLAAFGGSAAGGTEAAAGTPGGGPGLAGLLGKLGGLSGAAGGTGTPAAKPAGNALNGLGEIADYLGKNAVPGRNWGIKDVPGALQVLRSPNVQALIGVLGSLGKAAGTGGPLAALFGGPKAPSMSAEPAKLTFSPASPTRFRRPEGPVPVVEPWSGGSAPGRWVWTPGSGGAA